MVNKKIKKESGAISRRELLKDAGLFASGAIITGIPYYLIAGSESSLEIMNPVGELTAEIITPALRLETLDNKRVGLYVSRRANAFEFLARVAENLKKHFKNIEVIGGLEGSIWSKESYDRPGDIDALLTKEPDAIIMALSS